VVRKPLRSQKPPHHDKVVRGFFFAIYRKPEKFLFQKISWGKKQFNLWRCVMMENIKLDNGRYLNRMYGKYQPNITFLSDTPIENIPSNGEMPDGADWDKAMDGTVIGIAEGTFFKSKKGTDCFDLDGRNHVLITVDWGGSFRSSRGDCEFLPENMVYNRKASSNGGGNGYTFIVVPVGYKFVAKADEI
jgi:hypothetical protein